MRPWGGQCCRHDGSGQETLGSPASGALKERHGAYRTQRSPVGFGRGIGQTLYSSMWRIRKSRFQWFSAARREGSGPRSFRLNGAVTRGVKKRGRQDEAAPWHTAQGLPRRRAMHSPRRAAGVRRWGHSGQDGHKRLARDLDAQRRLGRAHRHPGGGRTGWGGAVLHHSRASSRIMLHPLAPHPHPH